MKIKDPKKSNTKDKRDTEIYIQVRPEASGETEEPEQENQNIEGNFHQENEFEDTSSYENSSTEESEEAEEHPPTQTRH